VSGKIEMNHVDGNVKNVPPSMLLDQFGMLGLLMMIKQKQSVSSERERNMSTLYSMDESLMMTGEGNRLIEPCDHIPSEYNIGGSHAFIKDKLGSDLTHVFQNSNIDLLFYMFYNCCKSELQLRAHDMLVSRGWCYDAKFRVWLKCVDGQNESAGQLYDLFDPNSWSVRRVNLADLARAAAVTGQQ
jgi:CCR4-NOT transcriptional regulation complex NOT5 subunit